MRSIVELTASLKVYSNSKFKVYPLAIGIKRWRCAIGGAENAPVREVAIPSMQGAVIRRGVHPTPTAYA
ncbi:MAG: hypothetical protein RLZZ511_3166, partial [Cyanobacteriota bacterium]